MNEVVGVIALVGIDRSVHTDVLDAVDLGDAARETKQPGPAVKLDSQVGMGYG